jgi:aspartyl/asparaginyl beta-hydroxylase (cupin superfamily)
MFIESTEYPFLKPIQDQWQDILSELSALEKEYFVKWPERSIYDGNWTVFALFRLGEHIQLHNLLCPITTSLLEKVPGLVNAGFSSLASGVYIGPHYGYTKEVLRCHIGLITPPNCAIRVGSEIRSWDPGSSFVFDDTQEHEAWNRSDSTRVVLLFDFKRNPDLPLTQFPDDMHQYQLVSDELGK